MFYPYSHSKLSEFETCPYRFKLHYIDKATPEARPEYFKRGSKIHAELERYPDTMSSELKLFISSDVGQKYDTILRSETKREVRLGFTQDFNINSYSRNNAINFIVDLIYMKDDIVYLVDWKTGKRPQTIDWSQLELYAAAFLDQHPVVVSYVYVDDCSECSRRYEMQDRAQIISNIKSKIHLVENCQEFQRSISWKCEYCQFKSICNPQQFSLENVTIEINKKDL